MNNLLVSNIASYIIMGALLVGIIGLFVWQTISGKKKQKEADERLNNIKIGDRIKTIGGVCGFLVEINEAENTIVIETGNENKKCYVKFDRQAIYQTAPANASGAIEVKPEEKPEGEKVEEVKEEKPVEKKTTKAKKEKVEEVKTEEKAE